MASPRPGPWLSLVQTSYKWPKGRQLGGAAETMALRPPDNGGHVPQGQQSFVTQWAVGGGQQPGQLLPPTGAEFSNHFQAVFSCEAANRRAAGRHLMPAWWAQAL